VVIIMLLGVGKKKLNASGLAAPKSGRIKQGPKGEWRERRAGKKSGNNGSRRNSVNFHN